MGRLFATLGAVGVFMLMEKIKAGRMLAGIQLYTNVGKAEVNSFKST